MLTEETYREAHRRSHKLLGSYLALWAWTRKVDCVVLPREQLLPFLGLEQMRNTRIEWLKDDLEKLFPHAFTTESGANVYATLYLSRLPIPSDAKAGKMTDEERVEVLEAAGLNPSLSRFPKNPGS